MLSVIIPASNEEGWIGRCLAAVLASDPVPGGAELVVVANGCQDATASVARGFAAEAQAKGWGFEVLDLAEGGKVGALNAGDAVALGELRAYLDADVTVSAPLLAEIAGALAGNAPIYAAGTAVIPTPQSRLSRAYARFWLKLPFNHSVAPGYGLFAVNATGRARWGAFPEIISDDTWVRLQFTPEERVQVAARYDWPMIEGFRALVRVRRRQNAGVAEIASRWPGLMMREGKPPLGRAALMRMALADPAGFISYAAVIAGTRFGRTKGWTRGR